MSIPKFSIIVPHYEGTISQQFFMRGMQCLVNQSFENFEVLIYHDGPPIRKDPLPEDKRFHYSHTPIRYNNWGHSLRDLGIKEAKGEYIIHFNPDNILYPYALKELYDLSVKDKWVVENDIILIYPVLMRGLKTNAFGLIKVPDLNEYMILTGYPTVQYNIDCMQLVMKTEIWRAEGGWSDLSECSDGKLYEKFVQKYAARYANKILGEHW